MLHRKRDGTRWGGNGSAASAADWNPRWSGAYNIGSNDGLIDVIQQYTVDTRLQESTQYHVWLVDLNIYTRVYKVWSLVVRLCVLV